MAVKTVTHLNFRGDARAALEFYQSVFGGTLTAVTYREAGNVQDPAEADQLMWGQVAADSGFAIMAYDVPSARAWGPGEIPFFVSVRCGTGEECTTLWEKLALGAKIEQALAPAAWAPLSGTLKDRFGITWVMDAAPAAA